MKRQASSPTAAPALVPLVLALAACATSPVPGPSGRPGGTPRAAAPPPFELLATLELATGERFGGTEVGGLSALAYDAGSESWLALSDDRGQDSERGPARVYELLLSAADGNPLGRVEVTGVLALTGPDGEPLPAGGVDPEGLALASDGLWVASEGVAREGVAPFVRRFGRDGRQRAELPLPERFLPGEGRGVRDNLGFEALAVTPGGSRLIAGAESALVQDGPEADHRTAAAARLVVWDLGTGEPVAEHAYPVDPLPWPPAEPGGFSVSGLVELAALDRGRLLALERAYADGRGLALKLYRVDLAAAADVSALGSLAPPPAGAATAARPAAKRLVLDLGALLAAHGVALDNLEGMAFGPDLPDGRRLLMVVGDNNFSSEQRTLFVALAVARDVLE